MSSGAGRPLRARQPCPVRGFRGFAYRSAHTSPEEPETSKRAVSAAPVVDRTGNDALVDDIRRAGLEFVGKREHGGALWVIGGRDIRKQVLALAKGRAGFSFKEGGGRAAGGRDAWWTRARNC